MDSGTAPLLLASNVLAGRRGLTARVSRDGGQSWAVHATLEAGTAGYSALADLGGGWAGCMYERRRPKAPRPAGGLGGRPDNTPAPRARLEEEDVLLFVRFNVSAPAEAEGAAAPSEVRSEAPQTCEEEGG